MKIVAVTSCVSGIAHTYIAKEKLEALSKEMGFDIKVETQGLIGVNNELSESDIVNADIVLIAADIDIVGEERFENKKVFYYPINKVLRNTENILNEITSGIE